MPPPSRNSAYNRASNNTATGVRPPKKAKHPSNQPAIDRLEQIRQSAAAQNSRYGQTVKRALDSLAACKEPIQTRKDALVLKYVGAHIAKIIVPEEASAAAATLSRSSSTSSGSITTASRKRASSQSSTTSTTSRKQRQTTLVPQDDTAVDLKPKPSAKQVAYDKAVTEAERLVLPRTKWKVVLLLDGREQKRDHVQAKLQMSGMPCEQRHLPIGDMAWIARSGQTEILLGTIVERKTNEDLASSLFGTRYLEQRLRLQHSGVNQVLLLVEGDLHGCSNCPADTLKMAMMETRIQLNFQVVQTRHLDDTVRFLKRMHRRILQRSFPEAFGGTATSSLPSFRSPDAAPRPRKKKKISLVDMVMDTPPKPSLGAERFITYEELKAKIERDREAGTRTVGAVHLAMLKQIPTFSHKKVQAIGHAYSTPTALMHAYDGLSEEDGKTLVQDLSTSVESERQCRVGPKSAMELYFACTQGGDPNRKQPACKTIKEDTETPKRSNVAATAAVDNDSKPASSRIEPAATTTATAASAAAVYSHSTESVDLTQDSASSDGAPSTATALAEKVPCGDEGPMMELTVATKAIAYGAHASASLDLTQDSTDEEDRSPYSGGWDTYPNATEKLPPTSPPDASIETMCQQQQQQQKLPAREACNDCVDLTQDDDNDEHYVSGDRGFEDLVSLQMEGDGDDGDDDDAEESPEAAAAEENDVKQNYATSQGVAAASFLQKKTHVTLHLAPWEEGSSEEDSSSSDDDDDEPLMVRCHKRQKAESTVSERNAVDEKNGKGSWKDDANDIDSSDDDDDLLSSSRQTDCESSAAGRFPPLQASQVVVNSTSGGGVEGTTTSSTASSCSREASAKKLPASQTASSIQQSIEVSIEVIEID